MSRKDHEDLTRLLDELVSYSTQKFPGQIVSMVLFGSATTGEWVKGKSDIDCIVIVKEQKMVKTIEEFLHNTLFELDSKYKLDLAKTCSIYKTPDNQLLNTVVKTEKFAMFGRPFYVLSEDQIDFANAKIKGDFKIFVGTHVIASLNLFFHRIKSTGRVLYGKDITKEFPTRIPRVEKFKACLNALLLLYMSLVTLPLDSRMSFSHAVKANFWACDDVLFALEKPLSNTESEIHEIKNTFNENVDVSHLHTSLEYKKSNKISKLTKGFVFRYIVKTTRFVFGLYAITIQKIFS